MSAINLCSRVHNPRRNTDLFHQPAFNYVPQILIWPFPWARAGEKSKTKPAVCIACSVTPPALAKNTQTLGLTALVSEYHMKFTASLITLCLSFPWRLFRSCMSACHVEYLGSFRRGALVMLLGLFFQFLRNRCLLCATNAITTIFHMELDAGQEAVLKTGQEMSVHTP